MAKLQQFYGSTPMTWLEQTPMAVIRALLQMLPKLEADQQLINIQNVGVGNGNYDRTSMNRIMNNLSKVSTGNIPQSKNRKRPQPAVMAAMGISVVDAGSADNG